MSSTVPTVGKSSRRFKGSADEIDYEIHGQEMQFVEIELDPGESAIAEAGSMMYKNPAVHLDTVFGDGSQKPSGFFGSLASAGTAGSRTRRWAPSPSRRRRRRTRP